MFQSYGLRTHIWNNNLKSALLMAGFPVLLAALVFGLALLAVGLGFGPPHDAGYAVTATPFDAINQAQRLGAAVGARRYSQDFELEADRLGTEIAFDAGFDPERGALFFDRLPDPGNTFLGSHPPNAAREQAVEETLARLRGF